MSFELAGRVMADPDLTDFRQFAVMLALSDSTNKETMTCYPSVQRIAQLSRLSLSTVHRTLRTLESAGWVQMVRRVDQNGMKRASIYRITKYPDMSVGHIDMSTGHKGSVSQTYRSPREPDMSTGHINQEEKKEPGREPFILSAEPPKKEKKCQMPEFADLERYVVSIGMQKSDAEAIRDHWLTNGFRTKLGPIKDWESACRTWKRNKDRYAPVVTANGNRSAPEKAKFVTHEMVARWCSRKGWTKLTEIAWGKLMGGTYYGKAITNEIDFNAAMSAIYEETDP